jgi:hypothetical protein
LALGSTQGETERFAVHFDSKNPTDKEKIEELINEFVAGMPNGLEDYIDKLVATFSSASTIEGTFFRGVKSTTSIVGSKIGPSPRPREGRYNRSDEMALYLIDSVAFLSAELGADDLLVQEYHIKLSQLRVADLTPDNKDVSNSLSLLFQAAERGKTGAGFDFEKELSQLGKSRYLVSQSISTAFKYYGWQGLYVPGVHGNLGTHYKNLALFGKSVESWEDWTIGNSRAYSSSAGWGT